MRFIYLLLILIGITGTGGTWLFTSTSGLQWLLSTASRVSADTVLFTGVSGTLRSMRVETISFASNKQTLFIQNFKLDWQPSALLSGKLIIDQLSAQDVNSLSPPSSEPASLPKSLHLPISLSIQKIAITRLRLFSKKIDTPDFVATNLSAELESDGQNHYLSNLEVAAEFVKFHASAQINGNHPFNVIAKIKLTGSVLQGTSITTMVSGHLTQLDLNITASGGSIIGNGSIQFKPFDPFPLSALQLSIAGLNPNTFLPGAPTASLALYAKLAKNNSEQLTGELLIKNSAAGSLDANKLPLHTIRTDVKLTTDSIQLNNLLLSVAGNGSAFGDLSWQMKRSSGLLRLEVSQLNPQGLDSRLKAANIHGNIMLSGDVKAQQGSISLKSEIVSLDAKLTYAGAIVILKKLQLRSQQSLLTGSGKLYLEGEQAYQFDGKLTHFDLSDFLRAPHSDLNATLKVIGSRVPSINGSFIFNIKNSTLGSYPVAGNGAIKFSHPKQTNGTINLQIGTNFLHAHGDFGALGDKLQLDISAPALAQIGMGLKGSLHLHANLLGSAASPEIRFDMTANRLTLPNNHSLSRLTAHGSLRNKIISFNISANNYQIKDKTNLQQLNISISGQQLSHTVKAEIEIDDTLQINLEAIGALSPLTPVSLDSKWIGQLLQLSMTGPLPLNLVAATQLELGIKQVSMGMTKLTIGGGQASIENTSWTPQVWQTQGEFTGISLRPREDQPALQLGGKWHFKSAASLTGHLHIAREKGDWVLTGEHQMPLGLQKLQFTAKASKGYLTAELIVAGTRVGKTQANINLPLTKSGNNWSISPNTPLNGKLTTNIDDISWIGQALRKNIRSDGQFNLQAKFSGTLEQPKLQGEIHGENLVLELLDHGVLLQQGRLVAHFDKTLLHIDSLKFSTPGTPPPNDPLLDKLKLDDTPGAISISGVIGLDSKDSKLNIGLNRLPLAHETNHWILVSGDAQVRLKNNTLAVTGNIIADAGFLTQPPVNRPQLADDIIISGQSLKRPATLLLNIDTTLDLGKEFYIRASGLKGHLAGRLHLTNDQHQNLTVTGSISAHEAKFEAYGQELIVKRGIVTFNGPLDDPGLNVLAIREETPVKAGVEVMGTVRRPRVRLVSTPNMSDAEKLSWLVFGRSLESGAGLDTSMLIAAAGSIFGGQSSGITRRLQQSLGVDELSIRQKGDNDTSYSRTDQTLINQSVGTLTGGQLGSNTLSGQIGTVGKRISSRAYISYERGLTASNAGITKLTYTLTPKIKIITQAGVDSAADIFYTFQFDSPSGKSSALR